MDARPKTRQLDRARETPSTQVPRRAKPIVIPMTQQQYDDIWHDANRVRSFIEQYSHQGCHRTSNAVDRPMNRLYRLMSANRGLHGHQGSSELRLRGWALLLNFRPSAPRSNQPRIHDSPVYRLNGKRYHEHWLHNLMASTSLMGFRRPPTCDPVESGACEVRSDRPGGAADLLRGDARAMDQVRHAGLWFVVMATAVTAIGGFLFGYDTAVINGAISYLKADMGLDSDQEGAAGASAILGCIPGAMCAGFLADRFGRKKMLFLCAVLYAGLGHSLRHSPDLRAVPRRAVPERAGHRSVVDDLSRLYRRDCAGAVARSAGHALSARDRHGHLPHAVHQQGGSGPGRRDLEHGLRLAVDARTGGRSGHRLARPAVHRAREPTLAGSARAGRRGEVRLREGRWAGPRRARARRDPGRRHARGGPVLGAVHGTLSPPAGDRRVAHGLLAVLRDQRDPLLFLADLRVGRAHERRCLHLLGVGRGW